MPNQYFSFKQFTIWQNNCAMKVTTDACLFGAWAAHIIQHKNIATILDIGTGTCLLSLMLAQQNPANIHAVEIDGETAKQAENNFTNSAWGNRLQVFNQPIQAYNTQKKYSFIITNPPFYQNNLTSLSHKKNIALHSTQLNFTNLLEKINELLTPDGTFAVLLPNSRLSDFLKQCSDRFYVEINIAVKQSSLHPVFRNMLYLSRNKNAICNHDTINIKTANNNYDDPFKRLLQAYYLNL